MSRIDINAGEIYLRLGATPATRSARADRLFRRLRSEEEQEIIQSLLKAPRSLDPAAAVKQDVEPVKKDPD